MCCAQYAGPSETAAIFASLPGSVEVPLGVDGALDPDTVAVPAEAAAGAAEVAMQGAVLMLLRSSMVIMQGVRHADVKGAWRRSLMLRHLLARWHTCAAEDFAVQQSHAGLYVCADEPVITCQSAGSDAEGSAEEADEPALSGEAASSAEAASSGVKRRQNGSTTSAAGGARGSRSAEGAQAPEAENGSGESVLCPHCHEAHAKTYNIHPDGLVLPRASASVHRHGNRFAGYADSWHDA